MPPQLDRRAAEVLDRIVAEEPPDSSRRPLLEQARSVVLAILEGFDRAVSAEQDRLRSELAKLAGIIAETRREVEAVRVDEIGTRHLPLVNGEMGAIAAHLESATGDILDACEAIEAELAALPNERAAVIRQQVTRIYEACNFHDITGQRIRKVVNGLENIEGRVEALLSVLGEQIGYETADAASGPDESGDPLLEGPQLPGAGSSQNEIDALFG